MNERLRRGAPVLALLLGLTLTLVAWGALEHRARDEARVAFDARVADIALRVEQRLMAYEQVLRGGVGLFDANLGQVSRAQWRAYVSALRLEEKFPGIQGVGFARHLSHAALAAHEQAVRAEGFPAYAVSPPGDRPEHAPIEYIEPFAGRNLRAFGFDMWSEPTRRAAMQAARDSGRPGMTGRVTLVQEDGRNPQPGVLAYLAVYTLPQPLDEAQRRATLIGWIYSPFRLGDLMHGILGAAAGDVDLALFAGPRTEPAALLYSSGPAAGAAVDDGVPAVATVRAFGQLWTLAVAPSGGATPAGSPGAPALVAAGGVLGSLLLAAVVAALARAQARAAADAARMADAHAEAERANRAKDELLAVVSHELRTPLAAIQGWLHVLQRRRPVDAATLDRAMEVIQRNLDAQMQVVSDLLDTARAARGKFSIAVEPMDFAAVVRATVESMRPGAEAQQLRLAASLPGRPVPLLGDAQRLQQVSWNLLSNALKFTPAGGRVDVSLDLEGGRARLRVSDTGRGIDPAFLPHVFERFRQADSSTTRAVGGLGLGLALVKDIVEAHGGTVRADSDGLGRGASFIVELPLRSGLAAAGPGGAAAGAPPTGRAAAPAAHAVAAVEPPRGHDAVRRLEGLRALVLEPRPGGARHAVAGWLQAHGARVTLVDGAGAAWRALDGGADGAGPDVLLCGPDEDALQLLARARRRERRGPSSAPDAPRLVAIATSAGPRKADREHSLREGFDEHLAEPVDPSRLMDLLEPLALQRRASTTAVDER